MPELDPVLRLLLLLKNNWNLTGDFTGSNIAFTTRWYDTNIMLPQITITPLGSSEIPLTTGNQPIYRFGDAVGINIWVRPKQDSNTSIGWAKNAVYQLRKEIDRILMTGSRLATGNYEQFVNLGGWRQLDEVNRRPVVFRIQKTVVVNYFRDQVI